MSKPGARRGEIWIHAGGGGRLTSKPRPALVVQSDFYASADWVTIAPITSVLVGSLTRPTIPATAETGLRQESQVMVDKITTIPRDTLQKMIGSIAGPVMGRIDQALLVYLGIGS